LSNSGAEIIGNNADGTAIVSAAAAAPNAR
jgi:hypothetical protein